MPPPGASPWISVRRKGQRNLHIERPNVLRGAGPEETVIRGAVPGYPVITISGMRTSS